MPISRFVYDPWELPPEQRQTTFVGRQRILDRFLAAVREQQGRATVQHYILTGPRGIGKTTLLLTLRDRIRQDPEISARWFCIQLREEEYYVHKQRDLWQLVLQALAVEEKLVEAQKVADLAQEAPEEEKSSALLVDGLRSICSRHGKRLLLLVDNFDHIFPSTAAGEGKHRKPDSEYRAFRKRLSTEAFLMTIATSVRVFEDIYAYDKGFFHFFSPIELPELSQEEAVEMLRRLGRADDNPEFLARLERSTVNLQTLWILTGGNPRLITMLYHILAQREIGEPVQALWETVAGLTPMLRQELADMPRQQSKTLDALLRLNGAAAPAEISRSSRLPLNVVTTQLGRLKEARYVKLEGGGKGRKATYRVADQMFSVWYWMRYVPVARRRIELFIDFLRAWFSLEERRRLFQERWERFHGYQSRGFVGLAGKSLRDAEYYAASLDDPSERLREMVRVADAYSGVGDLRAAAGLFAEIAGSKARSMSKFESLGYSVLASRLIGKGDGERAMKGYSEALAKDPENTEARVNLGVCLLNSGRYAEARRQLDQALRAPRLKGALRSLALVGRGVARGELGDRQGALSDCTATVEPRSAEAGILALALLYRGFTKGQLGDPQGEVADYTGVVDLKGAPIEQIAEALIDRGLTRDELGDHQAAISDYSAVLKLKGGPAERVSDALAHRGASKIHIGDYQGAIADCTEATKVEGAPPPVVARALVNRGRARGLTGDIQSEIADCTAAVELKGAEVEEVSAALVNRAAAKGRLGDHHGAISDSSAVIELKGAPVEQLADALFNRGVLRDELEDLSGAITDFAGIVGLEGAPAERVAMALVHRGVARAELDDRKGAIVDYTAAINLKGARAEEVAKALAFRGSVYYDAGRNKKALADFDLSLKTAGLPDEVRVPTVLYRGNAHALLGNIEEALADWAETAKSRTTPFVYEALLLTTVQLLSENRFDDVLAWVRRFHKLETADISMENRLEARLDMVRAASTVGSLEDVGRLVEALLETDPEEIRDRLRFLKPGLELARTNDESVLAKLPEEERKIAREIARSLAGPARQPMGKPSSPVS